jgi:hypothetical protein
MAAQKRRLRFPTELLEDVLQQQLDGSHHLDGNIRRLFGKGNFHVVLIS